MTDDTARPSGLLREAIRKALQEPGVRGHGRRLLENALAMDRALAADEPGLDVLTLSRLLEYIGDGEGQGYEGPRYDQYARNIAAEYARLREDVP